MAMEYLGESFDLHCGGEDLMFPHHENEIAQSETATHKQFARHWMHVRFLLVDGRKMSKSEGNFYTLRDLLLKGYKASAIRLALVSVPYRHQFNFTFEGLTEATSAIDRLRTFHERLTTGNFAAGENQPDAGGGEEGASRIQRGAGQRPEHRRSARADLRTDSRREHGHRSGTVSSPPTATRFCRCCKDFDAVFDVIEDRDAEPTRRAIEWAEKAGPHGRCGSGAVGRAVAHR